MAAVCLADIDQGQHHENERLQQNNQHMEEPPDQTGDDLSNTSCSAAEKAKLEHIAAEKRNEEEYELTSIHIAEESHTQRNELGQILNNVHEQIHWPQKREFAKRSCEELNNEAREPLNLDAVIKQKAKHTERKTERTVQICRRKRTKVINTDQTCKPREKSTGIKSMQFMIVTQQNTVSARGAI